MNVRCGYKFILLHVDMQVFQHHLMNRLSIIHSIVFEPLWKIICLCMHGSISGLSTLLISLCISFQYHTVMMTDTLYFLKSSRVSLPMLLFFRLVLAILYLLHFHMNFRINTSISTHTKKSLPGFWLWLLHWSDQFEGNRHQCWVSEP